jgi:hypothetical protein
MWRGGLGSAYLFPALSLGNIHDYSRLLVLSPASVAIGSSSGFFSCLAAGFYAMGAVDTKPIMGT